LDPDRPPGVPGCDRLFVECDSQGEILWMNERARARLGSARNFLDAVPSAQVSEAWQLLRGGNAGDEPAMTCLFGASDGASAVPVHFVRLFATERKVVLAAQVRARASDSSPSDEALDLLREVQRTTVRNYFRLLEAHRNLEHHTRRSGRPIAAILSEAMETERTRIARDLHSGVGQTLAGIRMNLELIEAALPDPPEFVRESLDRIQTLADQSLDQVRSISRRLHPPDWQRLHLADAIELLWKTTGIPEKFRATLDVHRMQVEPSQPVRVALYRAAQEGLSNLLRHADATEVSLILEPFGDRVRFVLTDNGKGFDPNVVFGKPDSSMPGIGLRALREEILGLDGECRITSGPGGTRMEAVMPVAEE
jgi:signal transduction histidine kinase